MRLPNGVTEFAIKQAVNFLTKDPEKNLPRLMDWVDKISRGEFENQRRSARDAIENPANPYHGYILKIINNIDREVLKTFFVNFILNANIIGWDREEELRDRYGCNIPWVILLDPTSACNLHCTGCWAAEYGNKLNLSFDEIDDIIEQGKAMGGSITDTTQASTR